MDAVVGPPALPSGTVTLLFTDIEGSTRMLHQLGDVYGDLLEAHHVLLRAVWEAYGGVEVNTEGDAFFVAFASADAALTAAEAAQRALDEHPWPGGERVRVRMGIHTGEPRLRGHDYWGADVHYAARLAAAAHGGQVLVSAATAAVVSDARLVDLGEHRLKDFPEPRRLLQLGDEDHPPPRTLDPLRSNLPSSPGPLLGRDAELAEMTRLLRSAEFRVVTVTGPGGTGKTRLALAVADELVDQFPDGAFLISLAELDSPNDVAAALAAPFGIRLKGDADALGSVSAALAGRELLLVLDNFEHVLGAAPAVDRLVAVAPRIRVLVTSQAPLRIVAEQVVRLAPLSLPDDDGLETVAASPAVQLLVSRARRAEPTFVLDASNSGDVARLCRALEGSPLALELAAARLALLSPGELLERLDERGEVLGRGGRDLPARQRGLRAALEWTHGLLQDDDAALFRRLGAFAGSVTLERAETICAWGDLDVLDSLARLIDYSLVQRGRDGRFVLTAAVHQYAREKLSASDELVAMQRRHAEAFSELADAIGRRFTIEVQAVNTVASTEETDFAAAIEWSERNSPNCFARLVGGLATPLLLLGRLGPWTSAIRAALDADKTTGGDSAWLRMASAMADYHHGHAHRAWDHAREAVVIADAACDREQALVLAEMELIIRLLSDGHGEHTRELHATAVHRAEAFGDPRHIALTDGLNAYLMHREGRTADAELALAALLAATERTDFAARSAVYMYPDCLLARGDNVAALDGYRQALEAARDRLEPINIAFQLEGIMLALAGLGREADALELAAAAAAIRISASGPPGNWARHVDEVVASCRQRLGDAAADAAWSRGKALQIDAAVALGLAV